MNLPTFISTKDLKCPDCKQMGREFFDFPVIGWLCPECCRRVQARFGEVKAVMQTYREVTQAKVR
jgi:hypothetical protein